MVHWIITRRLPVLVLRRRAGFFILVFRRGVSFSSLFCWGFPQRKFGSATGNHVVPEGNLRPPPEPTKNRSPSLLAPEDDFLFCCLNF